MGNYDDIELKVKLVLLGICIVLLFVLNIFASVSSTNTYNNGIHKNCGGHWVYESAIGHRFTTNFIYHCDKCGVVVELSEKY